MSRLQQIRLKKTRKESRQEGLTNEETFFLCGPMAGEVLKTKKQKNVGITPLVKKGL